MNTETTLVIFRKWHTGGIIALFPLIPSDNYGLVCLSYESIGQHGGASPGIVHGDFTVPATPSEYADLKVELERIGYTLKVGKRIPSNAFEVRRNEVLRMRAA